MSRIYEVYTKQDERQLDDRPTMNESALNAEEKAGLMGLFEFPRLLMDLSSELLEEFRCITKNLSILGSKELKTVMLCGIGDSNDSSTVALNLAVFMARTEEKEILLVETDAQSPKLHRFHKGKKCDGFCELLEEHRPIVFYAIPSTELGLSLIRVGGSNHPGKKTFSRAALEQVVTELESSFPFIVFDGPPVGTVDCQNLSGCVDGVVLVIKAGELAERVEKARSILDKAQAKILGVIMTR